QQVGIRSGQRQALRGAAEVLEEQKLPLAASPTLNGHPRRQLTAERTGNGQLVDELRVEGAQELTPERRRLIEGPPPPEPVLGQGRGATKKILSVDGQRARPARVHDRADAARFVARLETAPQPVLGDRYPTRHTVRQPVRLFVPDPEDVHQPIPRE